MNTVGSRLATLTILDGENSKVVLDLINEVLLGKREGLDHLLGRDMSPDECHYENAD